METFIRKIDKQKSLETKKQPVILTKVAEEGPKKVKKEDK